MWLKYVLRLDNSVIGLKFNPNYNKIVLGGYTRDFELFETIRTEFIESLQFKTSTPSHNKMRLEAKCSYKQFVKARDWLRKEHILMQRVQNHGRMFR